MLRPNMVCATLRQLKREQCRMSYMNREALDFIRDNKLVTEHHWPGFHLTISEAGVEYLHEHEQPDDE
jgi:hypothetical protein